MDNNIQSSSDSPLTKLNQREENNDSNIDGNTPLGVFLSAEGSASRAARTHGNVNNNEMFIRENQRMNKSFKNNHESILTNNNR